MKTVWRVFAYIKRYPWMAAGTLTCAILSTVMVVVFPWVTKYIIDDVIVGHRPELLLPMVMVALAAFFLQDLLNGLRILLNNSFEQKVIFDLRSDLFRHIERLPLCWFDNRATGDLITRVVEDVNSVERVLIDGIEQGVVAILQVLIVTVALFYFNGNLVWCVLVPVPLLAGGALAYTLTGPSRYRPQRRAASALNALLLDDLAGIRQIKSFVREKQEHDRFNRASETLRQATLRIMRAWALYSPSMDFINSLGLVLAIGFGGRAVLRGEMQMGSLVAFITLTRFLYEPVTRLHQLNQLVQAGRAAGERVFEILDEPEEPGLGKGDTAAEIQGEIRFDDVSFAYTKDLPALSNISFHARPGETIALVGATGAGKSTLVNLLARFYEYTSGSITIDEKPIRDFAVHALREMIGMVTQESFLFNGTIRENLLLGNPEATDEELLEAAASANARGFIDRLPNGLGSVVGERGVKLSVGEKQRLSIARALLKDPPILILDEATASVDTATERLIQQALENLMFDRTCIVIAHRLSTIVRADQILVLDQGRIIERGTHSGLLSLGGKYQRLCQQSFLETGDAESEMELIGLPANSDVQQADCPPTVSPEAR